MALFETVVHQISAHRQVIGRIRRASPDCSIFFIHGAMGSWSHFQTLMSAVAAKTDATLVAFDAFGCGENAKPRGHEFYSTDALFGDIISYFNTFSSPRKNYIVGHSFGSSQTVKLSNHEEARSRVNGIMLIGSALDFPPYKLALFYLPEWFVESIRGELGRRIMHASFSRETLASNPMLVKQVAANSASNPIHVCRSFYQQMTWFDAFDLLDMPHHLNVVIVQGEEDKITPMSCGRDLHERYMLCVRPNDKVVGLDDTDNPEYTHSSLGRISSCELINVPNASHFVMSEKPHICAEALLKLISIN